jgi:hypothetical protein
VHTVADHIAQYASNNVADGSALRRPDLGAHDCAHDWTDTVANNQPDQDADSLADRRSDIAPNHDAISCTNRVSNSYTNLIAVSSTNGSTHSPVQRYRRPPVLQRCLSVSRRLL